MVLKWSKILLQTSLPHRDVPEHGGLEFSGKLKVHSQPLSLSLVVTQYLLCLNKNFNRCSNDNKTSHQIIQCSLTPMQEVIKGIKLQNAASSCQFNSQRVSAIHHQPFDLWESLVPVPVGHIVGHSRHWLTFILSTVPETGIILASLSNWNKIWLP